MACTRHRCQPAVWNTRRIAALSPAYRARTTFAEIAEAWLSTHPGKASTLAGYRSLLDKRLLPSFGDIPIGSIDRPMIRSFVAELSREGLAPGTTRNALNAAKGVFSYALDAGALRSSPAARVSAPTGERKPLNVPTATQVHSLANQIGDYRVLVVVAAYSGMRAGELHGLQVRDVDTMRGRINVRRSVAEVHGELVYGPPKSGKSRTVSLPSAVRDELVTHLAPVAGDPDALVFRSEHGGPVRHSNFYARHFRPAADALGLRCRFHDLRHFAAASLIEAGAHPRVIMERLGHSSIAVTLDTYGSLFPSLDEALTDALDEQFRVASEDLPRPIRGQLQESGTPETA